MRFWAKTSVVTIQDLGPQPTENAKDSAVLRGCSWFVRHGS